MMGKKQTQKTGKLRVGALRKTERLLTEHKRTENIRRRSDTILDAVSFAAGQFLRTTDWKQSIQEVLERLGKATGVSRVYIFENNSEKDGNLLTSQRYEWCASGISPQIDNPDLQGFSLRKNGFERWEEMLGQGQLIQGHVKEFPESEKNVLTPQNIRSIVVTPIFVGQKWWGFIGFDECQIEREWSIAEIDALRAAAETLGAAIQQKFLNDTLKESEERYRTILENIAEGYYEVDLAGNFTFFNVSVSQLLGYSKDELLGMNNRQYMDEENAKKLYQAFNQVYRTGVPSKLFDWEIIRKDGMKRHVESSISLIKDSSGQPAGFRGIVRDITERKRAEVELRESEIRLKMILDSIQTGVLVVDPDTHTIVDVNPAAIKLIGTSKEKIINQECHHFVCPAEKGKCPITDLKQNVDSSERILLTAKGDSLSIIKTVVSITLEGKKYLLENFTDITERKKAEEALSKSEERYRMLVEESFDGVWIQKGVKIAFANRRLHEMLGYEPGELEGRNHWIVYHPDYQALTRERAQARLRGESPPSTYEVKFLRKDGSSFWGEINAKVINYLGEPGIQVWARDISERKQAEETLHAERERFRSLSENAPFGMAMIDKDGTFKYINPKFKELFGYDLNDVPDGKTWFRKAYPDPTYRHNVISAWLDDLTSSEFGEKRPRIFKVKCKDGTEKIIHFISVQLETGENLMACEDITERVRAEQALQETQEQLRQAQKMEAIGRLAGGIAHDFNNLLTVIKGYSELSLLGLREGDPLKDNLNEIYKAGERAANLTRQLLAFSRKQILEFKVLNLNALIQDLDKMLHRILGEDIELIYRLSEDAGKVKTDPGQIEQVILNLAVNARDAMPSGGKLFIETNRVDVGETNRLAYPDIGLGSYVRLTITDTGVGMTREVKEHLFEPFFTTKAKGKGTGLGLSTVYGIVKQSGGNINVSSEPGCGTTFNIYLPRVEEEEDILKKDDHQTSPGIGNETILIAEDERSVRELAVRILKVRGYQIYEVPDGLEALRMVQDHPDRKIDLLLTDVVMPGMSGKELADRLKVSKPDLKVLFISGYTDDAIVHHGVLDKGVNFVQKPFTPEALAKKVREVLDQ